MSYGQAYYTQRAAHPMWVAEAAIVSRLARVTPRDTVVEMGCGGADLLGLLGPGRGIGTDANAAAIDLASRRYPNYAFIRADVCDPPLDDRSVDCIVSQHVVEHLEDVGAALARWARALRPGGTLVTLTPNADFGHPEVYEDPAHRNILRGPQLAGLLRQAGLRVRRLFSAGPWALRTAPLMWRLHRRLCRLRLPALPMLRWRGQTLCALARKAGRP